MQSFDRVGSVVALACLVLIVATGFAVVAGASTYAMSVTGSTDIPDRTVTVEGTEYLVSHVGQVDKGESIQVTVDAPSDQEYDVYLYNAKIQIEQTRSLTGDGTASFSTSNLTPSIYLAAIYQDGDIQKLTPVVVAGYDISATAPSSVERGDSIEISISVTNTARETAPNSVQVVVGDDGSTVRVNATKSNGEYVATVPTDSFTAGDYALFAVARGENKTKYGRNVLLGMSTRHTVTITENTPTPTESNTQESGTNTGGNPSSDPSEPTPTPTSPSPTPTTVSPTPTETPVATPTATSSRTATADPTKSATVTPTPGAGGENALTPNQNTNSTSTGGQPGFGHLSAGIAFVLLALRLR